jgi:hypothetical protein
MSHFPVPFIYSEWEDEVDERYGRMSLARFNKHLFEDLPPARAEDQTVPANPVLNKLLKEDRELASAVILAALAGDPAQPQWSVAAACAGIESELVVPALVLIAGSDPDDTDRAFALRELARRGGPAAKKALISTIFGDSKSLRLLALEWLGGGACDLTVLIPTQLMNPFHYLFFESALNRLLPEQKPEAFFPLSAGQRRMLVEAAHPQHVRSFLELARQRASQPFAALVLLTLGNQAEQRASLASLEAVLLEQGTGADEYHSPEFWLRAQIIECLRGSERAVKMAVSERFRHHLDAHSPQREMLLVSFAYALNEPLGSEAEVALARVRTLETDNLDLILGAAMSLAAMESEQAVPSLIDVLSTKRRPFAMVAIKTLESLTGVAAPDRPEDLGILHKVGLPQDQWDFDAALAFWEQWYREHKDQPDAASEPEGQ